MVSPRVADGVASALPATTLSPDVLGGVEEGPHHLSAARGAVETQRTSAGLKVTSSHCSQRERADHGNWQQVSSEQHPIVSELHRTLSPEGAPGIYRYIFEAPDDLLKVARGDASPCLTSTGTPHSGATEEEKREIVQRSTMRLPSRHGVSSIVRPACGDVTEADHVENWKKVDGHLGFPAKQTRAAKDDSRVNLRTSPEALRPLYTQFPTAVTLHSCTLAMVPASEKFAKTTEGATGLYGDFLLKRTLSEMPFEQECLPLHAGCNGTSLSARPKEPFAPREQQQEASPPCSVQTAPPLVHLKGTNLIREVGASSVELLFNGVSSSTYEGQLHGPTAFESDLPLAGQQRYPNVGGAAFLTGAEDAHGCKFPLLCRESNTSQKADEPTESQPELCIAATGDTEETVKINSGDSMAALWSDSCKPSDECKHEESAVELLSGFLKLQAPYQATRKKSHSCPIESAHSDPTLATDRRSPRESAVGLCQELISSDEPPLSAASASSVPCRSRRKQRGQASQSTSATPLTFTDCTAAGVYAQTDPEECYTWTKAHTNFLPKLLLSLDDENRNIIKAEDDGTRHSLCARLRVEHEGSLDLSPSLTRTGPDTGTPVCSLRPYTNVQHVESDMFLLRGSVLPQAATHMGKSSFKSTETAASTPPVNKYETPGTSAPAPSEFFVLQRVPGGVAENIENRRAVSSRCPADQLQRREDHGEQQLQHLQRKKQHEITHQPSTETSCAALDGLSVLSKEHPNSQIKALLPSMLLEGTSTNLQQRTAALLAAPVGVAEESAADLSSVSVLTMVQPSFAARSLLPPRDPSRTSCVPPKSSAQKAVVPVVNGSPVASSRVSPECHLSCKRNIVSTPERSARLCECNVIDTVFEVLGDSCIQTESQTLESTWTPHTYPPTGINSTAPESEKHCVCSELQIEPKEISQCGTVSPQLPVVKLRDNGAQNSHTGMPDTSVPLSSFDRRETVCASSSTTSTRNSLQRYETVLYPGVTVSSSVQRVQSPRKALLSAVVAEEDAPDFASPPSSVRRTKPLLDAGGCLWSITTVANGALEGELCGAVGSDYASGGNIVASSRSNSTWRREGHPEQSSMGKDVGNSSGAQAHVEVLVDSVKDGFASGQKLCHTELLQPHEAYAALSGGALTLDSQRHSVADKSNSNATSPSESAGNSFPPRSNVQLQKAAPAGYSDSSCNGSTGKQPVSIQPIPSVLRTSRLDEQDVPPSAVSAGVYDHPSDAGARITLAAISMLELLAFLPTAQDENTGGRLNRIAKETGREEVKPSVPLSGADGRKATDEPMVASSSDVCVSVQKLPSFLEDPATQVHVRNVESGLPGNVQKREVQHEVTCKHDVKASAAIYQRGDRSATHRMTFGDLGISTSLVSMDNTSDIVISADSRNPASFLQPQQLDTENCRLGLWLPTCPAYRQLPSCLNAVVAAGNTLSTARGAQLKNSDTVDTADGGGAPPGRSVHYVVDELRSQLQQPSQQKLNMSTLHQFSDLSAKSGIVSVKTELLSRKTEEETSESKQRSSTGSPSPAAALPDTNCFGGDARPPRKPPAGRGGTEDCSNYARTQWTCAPGSSSWPSILPPCDAVDYLGLSPCICDSRQQREEEATSEREERSCVTHTCDGPSGRRPRALDVETMQHLTRTDVTGAQKNLQQTNCLTSEKSRDGDAPGYSNAESKADPAAHPSGGETAFAPDQQASNLFCVEEGIRKCADGVAVGDIVYEVVNTLADLPPTLQPARSSPTHQFVNSNAMPHTSETVMLESNVHGAAISLKATHSPLAEKISKNYREKDREAFTMTPSRPQGWLHQEVTQLQQQQLPQREQPEMPQWHQHEPKREEHRQGKEQLPDNKAPPTRSVGHCTLQKSPHTPETKHVASLQSSGHPASGRRPGGLASTRDAAQNSAASVSSKNVLSRDFVPYNNQWGSALSTRHKREALLSREQRHEESDTSTRRPFGSPRTSKTSTISFSPTTLFKNYKSAGGHEVQVAHYYKPPRPLPQSTSALSFPAAARGLSIDSCFSAAQPSDFPYNASKIPPPPPPPPPPPTPPPNTTAHCNTKINIENRPLPCTNFGASPPTVLPSLHELVDKAREISWLQVLQGILEQQARRGGGSASEAIAAALAVADASVRGPLVSADAPALKQELPVIPLKATQPLYSSPTKPDTNGVSSTVGEVAAAVVAASEDMRQQLQKSVEESPSRPVECLAERLSGSAPLPCHESWTLSLAAPTSRLSSAGSPMRPGASIQTMLTSADASWRLSERCLFSWSESRETETDTCVDTRATKGVTPMLSKREVSKEGDAPEGKETTSVAGNPTKWALKQDSPTQDPSQVNRQDEDVETAWRTSGHIVHCAVAPGAKLQCAQGSVSRERTNVQGGQHFCNVTGEEQRVGSVESQQVRRRPPRPSKRQRLLIRALAYVKQRLRTLECEVLPLAVPDPLEHATAPQRNASGNRAHRDA